MTETEILSRCDHTILKQDAVFQDIARLIDDAVLFGTASVCIPPRFVRQAVSYAGGKMPICTVIGFPNGYHTAEVKRIETREAIRDGADEIDMVIHIGGLKASLLPDGSINEEEFRRLVDEIAMIKKETGDKILKVIIETCLLTEEEKRLACRAVAEGGADYIKTSTGFSSAGAKTADIRLFRENLPAGVKIKAAGGIRTFSFAEELIMAGADRVGASALVSLAKQASK